MPPKESDNQLIEYKIQTLNDNFKTIQDDMQIIKDTVIRLESKFESYVKDLATIQKQVDVHSTQIDDLRTFRWKAAGVVILVVFILQTFGSAVLNMIMPTKAQAAKTELSSK